MLNRVISFLLPYSHSCKLKENLRTKINSNLSEKAYMFFRCWFFFLINIFTSNRYGSAITFYLAPQAILRSVFFKQKGLVPGEMRPSSPPVHLLIGRGTSVLPASDLQERHIQGGEPPPGEDDIYQGCWDGSSRPWGFEGLFLAFLRGPWPGALVFVLGLPGRAKHPPFLTSESFSGLGTPFDNNGTKLLYCAGGRGAALTAGPGCSVCLAVCPSLSSSVQSACSTCTRHLELLVPLMGNGAHLL